jgi:tetratricopeptide (TPR) repeat protein
VAPEYRERSIVILRRVLENRPRLARVWRELGLALVAHGAVREGVDALRRAVSLAPDDSRVLAGLGRGLLVGTADFKEAETIFARSVERNPEAGWYWLQLAHCRALLRDFKRGEKAAKRAIELQEAFLSGQQGIHLVGAYMRLGHLFSLQERYEEARDAFLSEINFVERVDHALRLRIRIELHTRLGGAHIGAGQRERAEEAFEIGLDAYAQRIALGADDPLTRYYAAAIHALRGENDEALELLERAADSENRAFVLARARIEPEWRALRESERFQRLIG